MKANQRTNQTRNASYNRRNSYYTYADGNTVRRVDYDVVKELEEKPLRRVSEQTAKNRAKAARMSLKTVVFYTAFMAIVTAALLSYIRLQSANTAATKEIARLESQLNTMKLDNEEEYSRIMSSINMDEIKVRAIEELGMQYAQEGQIVVVQSATNDYVRQYMDMP